MSKSSDTFDEWLANEGEQHMLEIVKSMDDYSLPAMRWKLRKTKYAIERLKTYYYTEPAVKKR